MKFKLHTFIIYCISIHCIIGSNVTSLCHASQIDYLTHKNLHDIYINNVIDLTNSIKIQPLIHYNNSINNISINDKTTISNNIINPYDKYNNIPINNNYFTTSQIQLNNQSINIFHTFNKNKKNLSHKILSFIQVNIQNILSDNKIISVGTGKKHILHNQRGIGYNMLYHIPIINNSQIHQPHSININGEYWYHNFLFSLKNYYNLTHLFFSHKNIAQQNIISLPSYPILGYQINTYIHSSHFSKYTGIITLEHFLHNTKNNTNLYHHVNNSPTFKIGLKYQPIPALSIHVDHNIFSKQQYNHNTNYKINIHYQSNTFIKSQVNNINKHHQSSPYKNIHDVIEPFIYYYKKSDYIYNNPTELQSSLNHNNSTNDVQEMILGYPSEIKIIKINCHNHHQSIHWDFQNLKNKGGKIISLQKNVYALHLPDHCINPEDQIICNYYIVNNRKNKIHFSQKKQLLILVKNYQQQSFPSYEYDLPLTTYDASISNINNQPSINANYDTHNHDNTNSLNDLVTPLLLPQPPTPIADDTHYKDYYNNDYHNDNDGETALISSSPPLPPPPPPQPIIIPPITTTVFTDNVGSLLLPLRQQCSHGNHYPTDNDGLVSQSQLQNNPSYNNNNVNQQTIDNNNYTDDQIILNQYDTLSNQLSLCKNIKFSSIGTPEYINKIEQSIIDRKNNRHSTGSDIEKILAKKLSSVTMQSSSTEDDCMVTDDSNNSDNDDNKWLKF